MLWINNPEVLRERQETRIREAGDWRATRRPRLKLVAMEAEAEAATVV